MTKVRLPAEWEPQSGIMLTWPHPDTDWAPLLEEAEGVFVRIGTAVSETQQLLSVCRDQVHMAHVRGLLERAGAVPGNLCFALADSDDTWARDHAPITTLDSEGRPLLHDFVFDGWGRKFDATLDTRINRTLHAQGVFGDAGMRSHTLVLEGGALESDGAGTLLATRSSVLDRIRNPDWDVPQIEDHLREHLGIQRFLWLDHGELSGDDTDAHVDVLARFTDTGTIVYSTAPADDTDGPALAAMEDQLRGLRTAEGQPYRLRPLPFPGVHRDEDGRRLPASYANFLICNQVVLLPVYGVAADAEAVRVLQECLPGHAIKAIDCRTVIKQNGSLHCLTMQFPRAVKLCAGSEN